MRARMVVVIVRGGGEDATITTAINCHNVDDMAIGAVCSIPPPLPSTMSTIAAINDCHCHCHTVDNDDCQKPAVMFVINGGNDSHY
jgi:hypothetical protein